MIQTVKKSYQRKVCFIMYIRKSILNGIAITAGGILLFILAFLFCFTEYSIPTYFYVAAWTGCLLMMLSRVTKTLRS